MLYPAVVEKHTLFGRFPNKVNYTYSIYNRKLGLTEFKTSPVIYGTSFS